MLALVDCNSFYASCEALFRPELAEKPIVVLSNNDGCVIARNNPAKELGIKMATPIFQIEELVRRHHVAVFSSNYALYGDISRRVMQVLGEWASKQEIYSIDESFLEFDGHDNPFDIGCRLRKDVWRRTGIPVGVGVGETKTLAKLANHCAKRLAPWKLHGVCVLPDLSWAERRALYANIPAGDVWGIGPRLAVRLAAEGVETVEQLRRQNPFDMGRRYSVVLQKTIQELNGEPLLDLEEMAEPRKQIVASRSFGSEVVTFGELQASLMQHVARAWQKLRDQRSVTSTLVVLIRTNPFKAELPQLSRSIVVPLSRPTDDLLRLQRAANAGLKAIFELGYRYKKSGVMLESLQPHTLVQADLFSRPDPRREGLMKVLEQANQRFGRGAIQSAAEIQGGSSWHMRQCRRSPRYTSGWDELVTVNA